jgi:hypothetical protein
MEFSNLIKIVGDEPAFETSLLLAGEVDPGDVRRQLSRWTKAGRLYQLRRGLYALAPPFQKVIPHPFVIANRMVQGSYVSCQSALAHYGLIPEYVPAITSVTAGRPARWETPFGNFEFRHLKGHLLRGYRLVDLGQGQKAFVAVPEKALLDLIHLHPGADSGRAATRGRDDSIGVSRRHRADHEYCPPPSHAATSTSRPRLDAGR